LDPRQAIAGRDWWHTIEVAPGVLTPGGWDLRPTAERLPWPGGSLAGKRCLDVGTMDGFWAFELERRGAAEVVAIDIPSGEADAPGERLAAGRPRGEAFRVAADVLGSRVDYRELNVYDLDPADVGEFDVVVMGYVLQMLRDPLRGLAAIRSVCRGDLILLDTVSLPLSLLPAPLARLNARRGQLEWFVFNARGLKQAARMAGFDVVATTSIFRDTAGPAVDLEGLWLRTRISHGTGILGRSAALRARRA
jgi:tRNA (mo5U34)-methyltransferase